MSTDDSLRRLVAGCTFCRRSVALKALTERLRRSQCGAQPWSVLARPSAQHRAAVSCMTLVLSKRRGRSVGAVSACTHPSQLHQSLSVTLSAVVPLAALAPKASQ